MSLESFTLTMDSPETDIFHVKGEVQILIEGNTPCVALRSVGDSRFFPMTDEDGAELIYIGGNPSGVIFNGKLSNTAKRCSFKIALDEESLSDDSRVSVTLSQGW